jgi:hypothetical protein
VKKIISLYQRNYDGDRLVRDEVVPGAEWVLNGEGTATRKWDGTCCLVQDGKLFKRYEVKRGKTPPPDFIPVNNVDENTGKQQGWRPVGDGPEDAHHREAWLQPLVVGVEGVWSQETPLHPRKFEFLRLTGWQDDTLHELRLSLPEVSGRFDYRPFLGRTKDCPCPEGTYELVGPKVQNNAEMFNRHLLLKHGCTILDEVPRTFAELRAWFAEPGRDIEGVVWWHEDGRMVKIKAKDFGLRRIANAKEEDTMRTLRTYTDSVGTSMREVARTNPVCAGDHVWLLFVSDYDEDGEHVEGIYTNEDAAWQAMEFALNPAPNHTTARIESMRLQYHHDGGLLRDWD